MLVGKAKRGKFGGETRFRIPQEILDAIDRIAVEEFSNRSEIIRRACIDYVKRRRAEAEASKPYPPHREDYLTVEDRPKREEKQVYPPKSEKNRKPRNPPGAKN